MRVSRVTTRRGVRLVQGDALLSEALSRPGATHSVFDVLAAALVALEAGPRVALLGFAAGGVVAPMRALGRREPIVAVDLDATGAALFERVCGRWAGRVDVSIAEAGAWLRTRRARFDAIVEDLSIPGPDGVTKPELSVGRLPASMARRLAPGGVAVVNLLPMPGRPAARLARVVAEPFAAARVVTFADYENRILLLGRTLPARARVASRLAAALGALGSRLRGRIAVRELDRADPMLRRV